MVVIMRSVILVHGFWHGSWCWSPVSELLAARSIPSVAVDLAGHGLRSSSPASRWARPFDSAAFATEIAPSAEVTATSAAAVLVEQIRRIGGGEQCVVVAHSMGGVVATAAAEQAPELFAHLMYVAAFAPISGLAAADYLATPDGEGTLVPGLLVADPAVVGALRIDAGDPVRQAEIRETFYQDVDLATAAAATGLLTPDGPAGVTGERFAVTPERYGAVPHSYVVCAKDNAVPVRLQRRFVREMDEISAGPTRVTELDSSHSPFLSCPADLVEAVAAIW